jgi:hypothetical protein
MSGLIILSIVTILVILNRRTEKSNSFQMSQDWIDGNRK